MKKRGEPQVAQLIQVAWLAHEVVRQSDWVKESMEWAERCLLELETLPLAPPSRPPLGSHLHGLEGHERVMKAVTDIVGFIPLLRLAVKSTQEVVGQWQSDELSKVLRREQVAVAAYCQLAAEEFGRPLTPSEFCLLEVAAGIAHPAPDQSEADRRQNRWEKQLRADAQLIAGFLRKARSPG